jgi:uncharacterized membrane protein YhiD involved in acid resistance
MPDVLLTDWSAHIEALKHAAVSLPIATALGAMLAFRPRRAGTPPRSAPVIHTQIVLAIVGAVVMTVVGASLARAFGIVGAANLIRYRAKIDDPKDAVVMLATLSLGLASGVGLYVLAVFATVFMLGVLWVVESLEPERRKTFDLKVTSDNPTVLRPEIETVLRRYDVKYELRSTGPKDLVYEANLPLDVRTDRLSNAILVLEPPGDKEVVWEEKKKK